MQGGNFAGRVSGGLLLAAGLGELVNHDVTSYTGCAVSLATRPDQLAALRARVRDTVMDSPLFDARSRARQFEAAYTQALARACQGLPPDHINVTHVVQGGADPGVASPPSAPSVPQTTPAVRLSPRQSGKVPLLLACGPSGSGTGKLVRVLAAAGLQVPGPLRTSPAGDSTMPLPVLQTQALHDALSSMMSPDGLHRRADTQQALEALGAFRQRLAAALQRRTDPLKTPLLVHHPLAAWFLAEFSALFDLRLVVVLRPLAQIEATRVQAKWPAPFGQAGARQAYALLMQHLMNSNTPFALLRPAHIPKDPHTLPAELSALCSLDAQPTAASDGNQRTRSALASQVK
jgi:hypothetical protein